MFSKKATEIDEIFTVDLTICSKCQIFVAFLNNTNFNRSLMEVQFLPKNITYLTNWNFQIVYIIGKKIDLLKV